LSDVMVACCGLRCDRCPALLARKSDDRELREKTAKEWSAQYNAVIEPEQINCEGCHPDGEVHFSHCSRCEIRACALERGLENCAHCGEYPCARLKEFFEWVPEAGKTLDSIRERR